jgi:hypothetical protein
MHGLNNIKNIENCCVGDTMKKRCDFVFRSTLSSGLVYEVSTLTPLEMDYSCRLMLSTVEFCLVRSWSVSAGIRSVPDSFSGSRARSFNTTSTDPMTSDKILSKSKRIFLTPTLQHPLQTTGSHDCVLIYRVYLIFILPCPLTFRL